jgi:predicted metal-dependent HD superfamily phosphohydrolase
MNARELVSDAWRDLVRRHGHGVPSAESTLEELVRAYAEPHRHYHTLDHVADLLRLWEKHGGASDAGAVRLAILFHDAVYDPMRRDNEAARADSDHTGP